jgi:hypothetical protein
MEGFAVGATDGVIGRVGDFYFDDEAWVTRYLIVDTEQTPHRRRVLISPIAVNEPDWAGRLFPVCLTMQQVKGSPDIDTDKPVSRQQEMGYLGYYGYGDYWGGSGLWGAGLYPDILQAGRQVKPDSARAREERAGQQHDDPHLRSANAVMRYYVHATDGDIGHVDGFLVEEKTWAIRYLIVNTSNWWLGHDVLLAPQWIDEVNWPDCQVRVDLTRHAIQGAPAYEAGKAPDRDLETDIHAHYGRNGYWSAAQQSRSAAPHR